MEPKLPSSNRGPERLPNTYNQSVERTLSIPNPEKTAEHKHERAELNGDGAPAAPQSTLPPPIQVPEPVTTASNDDAAIVSDTPMVAGDDDLIEKEWVDKAKAIIVQTKDDPYLREKEVSKLQADYLRKRYGKELGVS